nr:hypothetical protein JVH1_1151 [Rhodococcus sp. JVH1]
MACGPRRRLLTAANRAQRFTANGSAYGTKADCRQHALGRDFVPVRVPANTCGDSAACGDWLYGKRMAGFGTTCQLGTGFATESR